MTNREQVSNWACPKCGKVCSGQGHECIETGYDYNEIVSKFDDCRAALARIVEALTGSLAHPPDDYPKAWHTWLIEQVDAICSNILEEREKQCQKL